MTQAIGTTMTLTQAQNAALGFAIAQTAYAMNNAGGLVEGQPLQYIDDYTVSNTPGASGLNLSIPAGYIVQGIYRDEKTGADVFLAYSASDKKALIGVAGSNGMPNDKSDTRSDIVDLGTNQTKAIIENESFRLDIERVQDMAGNNLQVLVAGQSLGGGVAKQIAIALVVGVPNWIDPKTEQSIASFGFSADQVKVISVNGFGTELAYERMGYSADQTQGFAQGATVQNFFVRNTTSGTMDAVTQMGGSSIGDFYALNATSDAASSLGGMHRFNFGVAEGLAGVGYNFGLIPSVAVPTPLTHASITAALQGIDGVMRVENNLVSLSVNGYAAILLSRPGETSSSVSTLLQRTFGMSAATSDFIGAGVEILGRALPFVNPAMAAKVLLGGLGVGKLLGSESAPAFEVNWDAVPPGFTRTMGSVNGVPVAIDSKDGVAMVRFADGTVQQVLADSNGGPAQLVINRPDGSGAVRDIDGLGTPGAGTLYVNGGLNSVPLQAGQDLRVLPGAGFVVESSGPDNTVILTGYVGNQVITQTGVWEPSQTQGIMRFRETHPPEVELLAPAGSDGAYTIDSNNDGDQDALIVTRGGTTTQYGMKLVDGKATITDVAAINGLDLPNDFIFAPKDLEAAGITFNNILDDKIGAAGKTLLADLTPKPITDSSGVVIGTLSTLNHDDGSTLTTTTYPSGKTETLASATDGQPVSLLVTTPGAYNTETVESYNYVNGQAVLGSSKTIETFPDDNGASRIETVTTAGGTYRNVYDNEGNLSSSTRIPSATENITQAAGTTLELLSTVNAIKNGQPLPILASGLRLANNLSSLDGSKNLELSGIASAVSGALSLMSLDAALKRGDTLGAITAGAQALQFGAQAFGDLAASQAFSALDSGANLAAETLALESTALAGTLGNALPYLGMVNALAKGDMTGLAVAVAAYFVPVLGQIYAVYSIISSLGQSKPSIPDPWGNASFVWSGTAVGVQSAGQTGGNEAVSNVMNSVLNTLNSLIERASQQNPNSPLGLIPSRMPGLSYDTSGYRYNAIDPLTGEQTHPELRFDTAGKPYNATVGSPESYQSLTEALARSALARGAIAPLWEVQTAKAQSDAGDPRAGLTEEERAGRDGQLATRSTTSGSTQTWRPVMLDLNQCSANELNWGQAA